MAAVDFSGRKVRSSKQKKRSKSSDGRARQKGTGRRRWGSEGGGSSGLQSPVSELGEGSQEARGSRRRTRRRKRGAQSLPRNAFRNNDGETERGTKKEKKRERKRGRSKRRGRESGSEEREKKVEDEEAERAEEEQEVPAVEERQEENGGQVEEAEEVEEGEEVEALLALDTRENDDDVFLPVPSPQQRLPRPKQDWEVESKGNWDVTAEYRERRREKEQERSWGDDSDENKETQLEEDRTGDDGEGSSPGVAGLEPLSQRKPFSFLTSTLSVEQLGGDESEYGGSQSDASVSAASISGLSLVATKAGGRRAVVLPGRWLKPSQQRVDAVMQGNEHQGRRTGQEGGGSSVS